MVWRRVLVPNTCTLRELHGVIQVAMGWEGIHLYQFCLRAARYGSWKLSASSPEVTLAALRLRKGARFTYKAGRPGNVKTHGKNGVHGMLACFPSLICPLLGPEPTPLLPGAISG